MQNSEEERWKTFQSLSGTLLEWSVICSNQRPLCGQQPKQHSSVLCFVLVGCRSRRDHTGLEAALARRSQKCPSHSPATQGNEEHCIHLPDSHRRCG